MPSVKVHPDTAEMLEALEKKDIKKVQENLINLLENFTLQQYPIVMETKQHMQEQLGAENVLMSGSGPTVFGLCGSKEKAQQVCEHMMQYNKESYWTRTTF